MKNKIYISGPITGLPPQEVNNIFGRIATNLNSLGWETVNPLNNGLPADASYNEHMLRDLDLLADCRSDLYAQRMGKLERCSYRVCRGGSPKDDDNV